MWLSPDSNALTDIYFCTMKRFVCFILATITMMSCGNSPKQAGNTADVREKPWREIAPTEIEFNPIRMIDRDWLEVSAGKEG